MSFHSKYHETTKKIISFFYIPKKEITVIGQRISLYVSIIHRLPWPGTIYLHLISGRSRACFRRNATPSSSSRADSDHAINLTHKSTPIKTLCLIKDYFTDRMAKSLADNGTRLDINTG